MRILDIYGDKLKDLRGNDLISSIIESEGRTIVAEVEGIVSEAKSGFDNKTSNAEMASAFGADIIIVNMSDPLYPGPQVPGMDDLEPKPESFYGLSKLLGRPTGPILEPDVEGVAPRYRVTKDTAKATIEGGATLVVITANPARKGGVSNYDMAKAVETFREVSDDIVIIVGKMHQSGQNENYDSKFAQLYMETGANGVIIPVPGTVPGVSESMAAEFVQTAHEMGGIVMSAITTSQEGSDKDTIRELALMAKRIGVDLHHISTAGYPIGAPPPENLYTYSVAIRGVRHTWNRMARNLRTNWRG